jgi:hypothetical protein
MLIGMLRTKVTCQFCFGGLNIMKKHDLKRLALMGLISGLTFNFPANAEGDKSEYAVDADEDGNRGYYLMSEDDLLLELNKEGTATYNKLSPEGKVLARKVASQRCNGTNECKGLNACKTDDNDCAGKGSCKGKSKCAFSDKNLAVKVVAEKMAAKRSEALK